MKAKRPILLILAWLGAAAALFSAVVTFDFDWNLFNWRPELDLIAPSCALAIAASLTAIWFLARATRDQVSRVVSLIVCLFLAGFAVTIILPIEPASGGFLGRTIISPWWFGGGLTLVMSMPLAIWLIWFLRLRRQPAAQ